MRPGESPREVRPGSSGEQAGSPGAAGVCVRKESMSLGPGQPPALVGPIPAPPAALREIRPPLHREHHLCAGLGSGLHTGSM